MPAPARGRSDSMRSLIVAINPKLAKDGVQ
jgi:hypothetical protein